jgi:hypothetical protein
LIQFILNFRFLLQETRFVVNRQTPHPLRTTRKRSPDERSDIRDEVPHIAALMRATRSGFIDTTTAGCPKDSRLNDSNAFSFAGGIGS